MLLALQWTPAAIGQVAWCQYALHATSVVRFHVTLCSINQKLFFDNFMYFEVVRHHLPNQHALCKQATYDKNHKRCNEPDITALPPVKLEICLRKHTSNSWFSFSAFLRSQESPKKKKNTQSHFVNELHAFCPFFFNYHMRKHRRGLMHTSFSISSHMFTYIIDMYVWFSVY